MKFGELKILFFFNFYDDFMQYPPEHKRVSEHIGRVLEHNEKI